MTEDSLSVPVKVIPKGGRDEVLSFQEGEEWVRVKVSAPPEDGRANRAVEALLAQELGLPKSTVSIVSGDTSRMKRVAFRTDDPKALLIQLAKAVGQPPEGCFRAV